MTGGLFGTAIARRAGIAPFEPLFGTAIARRAGIAPFEPLFGRRFARSPGKTTPERADRGLGPSSRRVVAMTAVWSAVERWVLATRAGDRPDRQRARPVLASSADRRNPTQPWAAERRNERRALGDRRERRR